MKRFSFFATSFKLFVKVVREDESSSLWDLEKASSYLHQSWKETIPELCFDWIFGYLKLLSFDPQVQVNGLIVISSFKGLSIYDQMTLSNMAPLGDQLATFQHFQILGMRFKAAFIFEQPPFMTWLWFFIRPFMSEKLTGRFFLCGQDYSMLSKAFTDTSILPADLLSSDGTNLSDPSSSSSNWMEEPINWKKNVKQNLSSCILVQNEW